MVVQAYHRPSSMENDRASPCDASNARLRYQLRPWTSSGTLLTSQVSATPRSRPLVNEVHTGVYQQYQRVDSGIYEEIRDYCFVETDLGVDVGLVYPESAPPMNGWVTKDSSVNINNSNNTHQIPNDIYNYAVHAKSEGDKSRSHDFETSGKHREDVLIMPHYDLATSSVRRKDIMPYTNDIKALVTPRLYKTRKQNATWTTSKNPIHQSRRGSSGEIANTVRYRGNQPVCLSADSNPHSTGITYFSSRRITPICQRRLEQKIATPREDTNKHIKKLVTSRKLIKSKSESNLKAKIDADSSHSDEENDDYGFLSWPSSCLSTAMQKTKSPTPSRKIVPMRWRSKSRPNIFSTAGWSPEGRCTWSTVSGRRVTLIDINILRLSEAERVVLQKIALTKLQSLDLGCPVSIPKECTGAKRKKRVLRMLKRKSHSANIASFQEEIKNQANDECRPTGLVFGIPLSKCIANDIDLQRRRSSTQLALTPSRSANYQSQTSGHRKSSSSSISSENPTQSDSKENVNKEYMASMDSLTGSEASSRNTSSSLIDALSLSTNNRVVSTEETLRRMSPRYHVPHIVNVCFHHIRSHGIGVLGIFRVGGSKKRIKQLHDEFDSGKSVVLTAEHNCHDVAALLKEYFRDLPEPLLTRDLYSAFVATRKLESHIARVLATRLLVSLLPVTCRDTLWVLLKFLADIAAHSIDYTDNHGDVVPGNKMDSYNLGMIFGPNILHKAKPGCNDDFQVEDMQRAEERKEVIAVVKHMIDHADEIFQIPADLHDDIIRQMVITEPELADQILKDLSSDFNVDVDNDGSGSVFDDSDTASMPRSPTSDSHFMNYPKKRQSDVRPPRPARPLSGIRLQAENERPFVHSTSMSNLRVPEWSPNLKENGDEYEEIGRAEPQQAPRLSLNLTIKPPLSPRMMTRTPDSGLSSASQPGSNENSPRTTNLQHEIIKVPPLQILRSYHDNSNTKNEINSNRHGITTPRRDMPHIRYDKYDQKHDSSNLKMPYTKTPTLRNTLSPPSSSSSPDSSHHASPSTSSQQRPLGLRSHRNSSDWDRELWKRWDNLTSDSGDDLEQETLV